MILARLRENGKVLVKELSGAFGVTEDCIRKDLAALEQRGLLQRAYGGAVMSRENPHREKVSQRQNRGVEQKRKMAKKALHLIHGGDAVFLDISTTNIEIAKGLLLANDEITVMTNMVEVMKILAAREKIRLVFVGGMFTPSRDGFVGSMSIEVISRLRSDISFIGTVGVNVYDNAVYTYSPEDGYTKEAILRASGRAYLLAETGKFSMDGNFKYAGIDAFRGILTDTAPGGDLQNKLREYQIEMI